MTRYSEVKDRTATIGGNLYPITSFDAERITGLTEFVIGSRSD